MYQKTRNSKKKHCLNRTGQNIYVFLFAFLLPYTVEVSCIWVFFLFRLYLHICVFIANRKCWMLWNRKEYWCRIYCALVLLYWIRKHAASSSFFPPIRISFCLRGSPSLFAFKNWKYFFFLPLLSCGQKSSSKNWYNMRWNQFIPSCLQSRFIIVRKILARKNAGKMKHSYRLRSFLSPAKCFRKYWFAYFHYIISAQDEKIQQCTESEEKKSTKLPQQDVFHFETWEPPYVR